MDSDVKAVSRDKAIEIIELFEDLLDRNNITIPDEDRESRIEEARIYGSTYYELEEKLTQLLGEWIK